MAKDRITKRQRQAVAKRARDCCEYCRSQERYSPDTFSIEHIIPRQLGGPNTLENLALACQGCNSYKAAKITGYDPMTNKQAPIFHPRLQRWQDHFMWDEDFTQVIGVTSIGRATVRELHLNRPGLVNLRRVLVKLGEHPPVDLD
ncbi:MAG: HNH endonuclease [Anaerolineae bacterium]|nr:HNH endonuclease [Anaerolineae bacterium]